MRNIDRSVRGVDRDIKKILLASLNGDFEFFNRRNFSLENRDVLVASSSPNNPTGNTPSLNTNFLPITVSIFESSHFESS
ncbi:hypothetical protein SDC9_129128 [bioreactor metagenome]|uniref:Uncharacterized protein n=1 Tax=bioreactor metagenome TaxID=1076179 RepID=A0A645CXZ5_9ZZZZ